MELLSPAGNREALVAAISCGADAVYLGYTAFGARSYAGNFDADGLREAVEYAHERGRKVYVTVNTLVKQCETDDLCDVLELLGNTNVDAVLVQDLGVARIAQARFPQLVLHASTQMTINNAQGAKLMQKMGFARVVPARECSLEELRKMADTGVEVEAFAHGALCVAVSGQCLFSSMIGGRSGNRGRCAQPCRLPYSLDDGTSGYLLSTKDLMLIDRLPELRDAGVYSFKLEGRMKRPEYVGVITRAYREALDAAEAHVPYHPDQKTLDGLRQVFNRGGFTEGYAMQKSNAALMSWQRPNHWGVQVGKIMSMRGPLAQVLLTKELNNGDGLQTRGAKEADFTYSGKDTPAGMEATVRIADRQVKVGDEVYRLTDAKQMKEIREVMGKENAQIPLDMHLYAMPGELPMLTICDDEGNSVSIQGETPVDAAQQRALDAETAKKQLGKLGGTPYGLNSFALESKDAFMTAGMLNSLRREALEQIRLARIAPKQTDGRSVHMECSLPAQERLLIVQGENLDDAKELMACGADVFEWQPQIYREKELTQALERNPDVLPALVLPVVLHSDELTHLHEWVCRNAARLSGVVANNPGQFELKWPVPVWGGQGLNVMNAECAKFFTALGAQRLTASCELNLKELRELYRNGGNYVMEAYGRTQLMLLNHCPRRTRNGDERQDDRCDACAKLGGCPATYTDRKGYRFPLRRLKMEHGCVLRLYNSVTTDMTKYAQKLHDTGVSLRLAFTDENFAEQKKIVTSYRSILEKGKAVHDAAASSTAGQLMRGVE